MPGKLETAVLFVAVAYRTELSRPWIREHILSQFGEIWDQSPPFLFSYSDYYEREMGAPLEKQFVIYRGLYAVENAVTTKLQAIELEQAYAREGRRTVNIDPGYLTLAKLVLTTTKNYDHRIHIGQGIYGDVQLRFRKGQFVFNPWTYPDYRDNEHLAFLYRAREYLHKLIREHEA
ncbi:MAG: DUF4416 family protein [candidate division KSB1 bacterium]|nr:DUF4416 family protein [candidate division KSB1 bacterium]